MSRRSLFKRLAALLAAPAVAKIHVVPNMPMPVCAGDPSPMVPAPRCFQTGYASFTSWPPYATTNTFTTTDPMVVSNLTSFTLRNVGRPPDEDGALVT